MTDYDDLLRRLRDAEESQPNVGFGQTADALVALRKQLREAESELALADKALAKAEADSAALRRFAGECLEPWPECLYDIDGQMQNRLHRAGLIEERIADHDGDDYEKGETVFFLTDAGKAALLAGKEGK